MADLIGQQIGNYLLTRLLGEGGFASVYLGQHVHIKAQQAAIKHLKTHVTGTDVQLFQQEAELVATLAHPNIVRLLDFEVKDSESFLIMDYAPNGSLRQRHPRGQRIPLATMLNYLQQLAEALTYAHSQKLIHRDIKPENMLIGRRGEVLLSDFGIAIIAQTTYASQQATQYVGGTAYYMAPEQFRGHATPLSDQYSLAVVAYEWLCGELPFPQGDFIQLGYQHNYITPPSLSTQEPTISQEVEQVVLKALEKDPQARFASVQNFIEALIEAAKPKAIPSGTLLLTYKEHTNWLHGVAWSPNGIYIASGARDKTAQVWEVATGRRQLLLSRGNDVLGIAWSPDSTRVASSAADATIQVHDVLQRHHLLTYSGHSGAVWALSWSPDGFRLASTSDDKTVHIWHAVTGQQLLVLRGHNKAVIAVAWSPNGKYLATASDDKTVQIWHGITGQRLLTYTGHSNEVWSLSWSPDGARIASASRDKTVQIWDSSNARTLSTYRGHNSEVNAVAWSPDGTRIASGAWDNTVHIWHAL